MNGFTIKDLENLSGIKAHTIRIWEQRYSFLKPKRSQTNIRYYQSDELKKLLNIALLNRHGFKISHIDKMSPDTVREKILSLSSAEAKQERMINELLHGMIDLETSLFEQILDDHIKTHGIDDAIKNLIFPFLHKIGILWMTDHIKIAQEHIVSNIIRQKLIMGIENARKLHSSNKCVVMFLPDGQYHELGLLYMHYLLKIRGLKIIYLGADVPVDELVYVCQLRQPDFLYTHLTSLPIKFNFEKYLAAIHHRINSTPVVISGRVAQEYSRKIPQGINLARSLDEVTGKLSG